MRQSCECWQKCPPLPKGLYCTRGYLFIRIFPPSWGGKRLLKGCGRHTARAQAAAEILLAQYRQRILLDQFAPLDAASTVDTHQALDMASTLWQTRDKQGNPITRTPEAIYNHSIILNSQIKKHLVKRPFEQLRPADIVKWRQTFLATGVKEATVNRAQRTLSGLISRLISAVKVEQIEPVQLPPEHPCKGVSMPSEEDNTRDRLPTDDELAKAQSWCIQNDIKLWDIVETALMAGRRLSELRQLKVGQLVEGVQGKTGKDFSIPFVLEKELDWTNFDNRWDALRTYMGWHKWVSVNNIITENPKWTTFHDLKSWAPTKLAAAKMETTEIQKYTQHADIKMLGKYVRPDLAPHVALLREELGKLRKLEVA